MNGCIRAAEDGEVGNRYCCLSVLFEFEMVDASYQV